MIILISLIIIFVIGLIILKQSDSAFGWQYMAGTLITIISGIILFVSLIGLSLNRMETFAKIAEYKSVEVTIQQTRNDNNQLENVALQHKVIDCNKWLASQLYYNGTLFDIWIPDEILELTPIK